VAHTLNFKPIFEPPLKKIVGGIPIPCGVWASIARLGHSVAHVKILRCSPLGAEIWSSEKVNFVGIIALIKIRS